jgi:cobalamin biosynthesis protein CbiG
LAQVTLASLARNFGWVVEDEGAVHSTEAILRSGGSVAFYADHEKEEGRLWGATGRVKPIKDIGLLKEGRFEAAIVVTYRMCDNELKDLPYPVAVIRPKVLILSLKSDSGLSVEETREEIDRGLRRCGLAWSAVAKMAALETDKNQEAFSEYARKVGLPIELYTLEGLEEMRRQTVLSGGIADEGDAWESVEAVAMHSACGAYRRDILLVPKTPAGRIILAVARSEHPGR